MHVCMHIWKHACMHSPCVYVCLFVSLVNGWDRHNYKKTDLSAEIFFEQRSFEASFITGSELYFYVFTPQSGGVGWRFFYLKKILES